MGAMKVGRLVLLLGIGVAAITFGLTFQQDKSESKLKLEKFDEIIHGQSGTINVAGTIVDQNGNALDGVEVEVAEVSPFDMLGTLTNRKTSTVDHRFRIKRQGVSSIECRFLKTGYYVERRSYAFSTGANDPASDGIPDHDIVIVLQKKPEPAPLEKYEGFLRSDIDGPISVLYLRKPRLSDTPLTAEQIKERKRLTLERQHVFLDPEIDNDGRLSRVLVDVENIGGVQTILREGWIGMSRPESGDGFIEATISGRSSLVREGFRQMTGAPATGYESQLRISAENGTDHKFFFCKFNGRYGKGVVSNMAHIMMIGDTESASVKIIVYLNPTGSTDVSYLHP